jgi:hypothetical protein
MSRGDRNAEHRNRRLCGKHPGQVSGAARTGDNDLESSIYRVLGVCEHLIGHAVGAHDLCFMGHTETRKDFNGL